MGASSACERSPALPAALVSTILAGDCVAFVGAGFSAVSLPGWRDLLLAMARELPLDSTRERIETWAGSKFNGHLEAAAQLLRDELGDRFQPALARALRRSGTSERLDQRLRLLRGIPFRAILTTNFDAELQGEVPDPAVYASVLRPHDHRWWDLPRYWDGDGGPRVVKLHGSVDCENSVVFSTRDYRARLYEDAAYLGFVRTIFTTRTILFLGSSFTDQYVNQLRSEILAMLGYDVAQVPMAYAVMENVPEPRPTQALGCDRARRGRRPLVPRRSTSDDARGAARGTRRRCDWHAARSPLRCSQHAQPRHQTNGTSRNRVRSAYAAYPSSRAINVRSSKCVRTTSSRRIGSTRRARRRS